MSVYDITNTQIAIPSNLVAGDVLVYPFTGNVETLTLHPGKYKLECWGAQGGMQFYPLENPSIEDVAITDYKRNGKAGYATGILTLTEDLTLYLSVGGTARYLPNNTGNLQFGGWNGGGGCPNIEYDSVTFYTGGGGTDISLVWSPCYYNDELGVYKRSDESYLSRLIVAGGSCGLNNLEYVDDDDADLYVNGGYCPSYSVSENDFCGSMTSGGEFKYEGVMFNYLSTPGGFGYGGTAKNYGNYADSSGGGGGWYGGAYCGGGSSFAWSDEMNMSSYVPATYSVNPKYKLTNIAFEPGVRSGDGEIRITVLGENSSEPDNPTTPDSPIEPAYGKGMYVKLLNGWKKIG